MGACVASEFGEFLRAHRKAKGWTLETASQAVGISYSRLAEIERGRSYRTENATRPSRELLERIATAYGLSTALLLERGGYPAFDSPEISDEARRVLALFESLPPDRRHVVAELLTMLAEPSQAV